MYMRGLRMLLRFRWVSHILAPGIFLSAVVLRVTLFGPGHYLPGDSGDTLLNLFFFEHNISSLSDLASWSSAAFYFPVEGVRGWSDHLFLPTLVYAPFRLLGLNQYVSLSLWFFVVLLVNYVSLRSFLWLAGGRGWISTSVCIVCSFNHALVAQLNHLQLLMLWFFPFLAYALLRFRWTWVLLAVGLNWLVAPYLGVTSILIVSAYLLVGVILWRRSFVQRLCCLQSWRVSVFVFVSLCGVVAANTFLIQPYLQTASRMGVRGTDEILKNLPNVWAWLSGTGRFIWGLSPSSHVYGNEPYLFPGFILSFFFVLTTLLMKRLDIGRRSLLLSGILLALAVTSFEGWTLWWLPMLSVPSVRAMNAAGRIAAVLWFISAFPIMVIVESVFLEVMQRRRILSSTILSVLVLVSVFSVFPKSSDAFDVSGWLADRKGFSWSVSAAGCDVIHFNAGAGFPWHGDVFAMHSILDSPDLRSVSGYSGWQPRDGWTPGMSAEKAFEWMRHNLGREGYASADSLPDDYVACSLRPSKQYVQGSGLFDVEK